MRGLRESIWGLDEPLLLALEGGMALPMLKRKRDCAARAA